MFDTKLILVLKGIDYDCLANLDEVTFDSYGDHRMAMSLAIFATVADIPGTTINLQDPMCVTKTYPDYWSMVTQFSVAKPIRSLEVR